MKWYLRVVCRLLWQLNWLPSYRRTRRVVYNHRLNRWEAVPTGRRFRWRGMLGLFLMNRWGLMWPYLDTKMPFYSTEKEN